MKTDEFKTLDDKMDKMIDYMEKRFDSIDERFDGVDEKFVDDASAHDRIMSILEYHTKMIQGLD